MRLPAEQRRLQLLEVALARFAENGFHATSMDEIAEAAGVTKPVLYQHFPSKRALYVELLEDTGRQLLTNLAESTAAGETPRERVEGGYQAYFRFAVEQRNAFRLLLATASREESDFAAILDEMIQAITESLALLLPIPDDQQRLVLASSIVGISESVSRRILDDPRITVDAAQLASWCSELTWFGLRGVRTNREPYEGPDRRTT